MTPRPGRFLAYEDVVAIHDEALEAFGGPSGLLSPDPLESAVAAPAMVLLYEPEADLFELAAAYAYHLTQGHAFADGNKRLGYLAALTFLQVNGLAIPDEVDPVLRDLVLGIAAGRNGRAEVAEALRRLMGR